MFVFEKMKDGKRAIRPAYIGFIKNNYLRRTLCIGFSPVTFLVVFAYNMLKLCLWVTARLIGIVFGIAYGVVMGAYVPAKGLLTNWDDIWHKPRQKD